MLRTFSVLSALAVAALLSPSAAIAGLQSTVAPSERTPAVDQVQFWDVDRCRSWRRECADRWGWRSVVSVPGAPRLRASSLRRPLGPLIGAPSPTTRRKLLAPRGRYQARPRGRPRRRHAARQLVIVAAGAAGANVPRQLL